MRNVLRVGREFGCITRNPIIEARADGDQKIAVLDCVVRVRGAMHAQHVQRQRMRRIERSYRLQRCNDWNLQSGCEAPKVARRIALDNAPAGVNQRPFALAENVEKGSAFGFRHPLAVKRLHPLTITSKVQHSFAPERSFPVLNIFGNVQNDGPGTIAASNFESGSNGRLEFLRVEHQKCALRARAHDVKDRRFLKRIGTDGGPGNLPADENDRNRVRHTIPHRRDAVGRTWT